MKRAMILLLFPVLLSRALAQLPDATEIMNRSRDLTLTGSLSATVSLLITEKNGAVRNRSISMITKSFPDGTEKRLIKFLEPADVRGTSMLIIDNKNSSDEMWIYMPALKKTRRIVSSEKGKSFMSSEFSNADMSSPTLSDFRNSHLKGSGDNNEWKIESIPVNDDKADEYGYSRKVTYLSADNTQVRKMEFFNFDNELFKTIDIRAVIPGEKGKYIIKEMVSVNLRNGRGSVLKFDNARLNALADDGLFSIQSLEK